MLFQQLQFTSHDVRVIQAVAEDHQIGFVLESPVLQHLRFLQRVVPGHGHVQHFVPCRPAGLVQEGLEPLRRNLFERHIAAQHHRVPKRENPEGAFGLRYRYLAVTEPFRVGFPEHPEPLPPVVRFLFIAQLQVLREPVDRLRGTCHLLLGYDHSRQQFRNHQCDQDRQAQSCDTE